MAHVSNGPVSTMPGSMHQLPAGDNFCDDHPEAPAVARIQGETDSFGAEYFDVCQECLDKFRTERSNGSHEIHASCDWCKVFTRLYIHRDRAEGTSGPVYNVCLDCIKRESAQLQAEWLDDEHPE